MLLIENTLRQQGIEKNIVFYTKMFGFSLFLCMISKNLTNANKRDRPKHS